MTTAEAFAPAKINLTLHVTGQRADGYHLLDSLVVFAGIGDTLTATPAADWSLSVTGPMAAGVPTGDDNLVLRAARMATDRPHAFTLDKHLPAAAGIGGGSADAAAAIRLCGGDGQGAVALGADIPVCLAGPGPVRMRGVGEVIDPLPNLPPLWVVLVNPRVTVSTPAVFKSLTEKTNPPMPPDIPRFPTAGPVIAWLKRQRNDLAAPAMQHAPVISDVLAALSPAPFAAMSGSGATCFGLCMTENAAARLASDITRAHPAWWVASAPILSR
ncbi:4-(cytidine 5'-diphospho)-2-C-methyl-D-erythritol kinase [Pseudaestuariivita atlantica]|uniref:4-diphosphocytidyl-2-C-methyl-D-erythritol kinase n=1 Tax=Pseudaestuariivita atlantica TaxID=1317121 RepID=A0A0L1JQU5_9RHOB|nr:4-(cytidine 5'-diphospho)-2-C-methyl-D-erythritol kinase [Pseudaestuariivita atlantica]KNG94087.1 4-diphosphocytidyl-2C-methyl-D-erythritol kinase [Pseudaestuariivita atlantica]